MVITMKGKKAGWNQVENKPDGLFSTDNLCRRRLKLDRRCENACAYFASRCREERGMEVKMNPYIGHDSQLYGIEEHRLVGGKGDGMRLYEVNNGKGLMMTVSPDRGGDITRLRYRGINLSYFSPCGYVAPAYYDKIGRAHV